jgi:photosystem II stability/assembly factor-like uncharacterized protein
MKALIFTLFFCLMIISIFVIVDNNFLSRNEKPTPSGAFEALSWFNDQRAFPNTDISSDKYYTEFMRTKYSLKKITGIKQSDAWQNIGPKNVGGRTLSIAIHPTDTNTVWLGSASGGLWKSVTGGTGSSAWTQVPLGFPVLGVSSVVIDPVNPSIMFIGTGETYNYQNALMGVSIRTTRGSYGIGILKSTDAGITWTKSLDWTYQQNRGVWDIIFNPLNTNVLYAGTTEGIYKSENAGSSWMQIASMKMVMDLAIDRIDTNIVYAGVGNLGSANPGVYRSTDSGINWTRLTAGLPITHTGRTTISTYHANPKIVMASIGNDFSTRGLYRSTNQGLTWTQMSGSAPDYLTYQGWFSEGVEMKWDDSSKVVVSGVDFYKSTNSGSNLIKKNTSSSGSKYMHVDHHDIVSNPRDPNKIYIGTDGGLFRSDDFGENFYDCNSGYVTTQFYAGFSNSTKDSTLAIGGLQDNGTWIYYGSPNWTKATGGDGVMTAINTSNDRMLYSSSQYLQVYKSTNRGLNWSTILSSSSSSITNFIAPLIISPSHPNILYSGRKNVIKSTQNGSSWFDISSELDGNKIQTLAVSYTSPDTLYAGTTPTSSIRAGIFKSTNGGVNWTNITALLPNRYPMDIAVNPNKSYEIYVAYSGFATPHIYRSTNGGVTWLNIQAGLPDIPFQSIVIDPKYDNIVYVGTDLGIYVSTNRGESWYSFNEGLPDAAIITDLTISESNRKLRASTHGNGVFERKLIEGIISSLEFEPQENLKFTLAQNYPNPFNSTTNISFTLPRGLHVELTVFNSSGEKIASLVNSFRESGTHTIGFDASNLSSGVYFYQINTSSFSEAKKLVLLR